MDNLSVLEKRVSKGFDLLFGMEEEGDIGADYQRYFIAWERLLREYEARA